MAIIYTYPNLSSLNGKDSFLVTDASDNSKTKTITWEDVLSSEGLVQNKKITLTSAQILDLHNTPVELIPAPGANKFIVVLSLYSYLNFQTASYITQPNSDLKYRYGDNTTPVNWVIFFSRASLAVSEDAYRAQNGVFPFTSNPPEQAWLPNQNVQAFSDAASSGGDSSIDMYISYIIKDL